MQPAKLREDRIAKARTDQSFGIDVLFAKPWGGGAAIAARADHRCVATAHCAAGSDHGGPWCSSRGWRRGGTPNARRRWRRVVAAKALRAVDAAPRRAALASRAPVRKVYEMIG